MMAFGGSPMTSWKPPHIGNWDWDGTELGKLSGLIRSSYRQCQMFGVLFGLSLLVYLFRSNLV